MKCTLENVLLQLEAQVCLECERDLQKITQGIILGDKFKLQYGCCTSSEQGMKC